MRDDLAIRARSEDVASLLKNGAKLKVVVDLPIADARDRAVFVRERL
jgi:hypothetical protein